MLNVQGVCGIPIVAFQEVLEDGEFHQPILEFSGVFTLFTGLDGYVQLFADFGDMRIDFLVEVGYGGEGLQLGDAAMQFFQPLMHLILFLHGSDILFGTANNPNQTVDVAHHLLLEAPELLAVAVQRLREVLFWALFAHVIRL